MGKSEIDLYSKTTQEWTLLIDSWIFSARDRAILKRRLLDGVCFEPLAEEFGMSVRQVKRIVEKGTTVLATKSK